MCFQKAFKLKRLTGELVWQPRVVISYWQTHTSKGKFKYHLKPDRYQAWHPPDRPVSLLLARLWCQITSSSVFYYALQTVTSLGLKDEQTVGKDTRSLKSCEIQDFICFACCSMLHVSHGWKYNIVIYLITITIYILNLEMSFLILRHTID